MAGRRYREWIRSSTHRRPLGAPVSPRPIPDSSPTGNAIRDTNRRAVLQLFKAHATLARADAARLSGLTKPTVSAIVDQLLSEGILLEDGPGKSSPQGGRPAALLRLNARHRLVLVAHVGVDRTTVGVADTRGELVVRREFRTPRADAATVIDAVVTAGRDLVRLAGSTMERVVSVRVALPGMIDTVTGFCHLAPNLGWRNVAVGEQMRTALGLPVFVRNAVHVAALAEATQGVGRGFDSVLMIYEDNGIGAAFVSEGRVAPGSHGVFGEIGHARLPGFEALCSCGRRGCFEAVASSQALRARLAAHSDLLSRNPYADYGHAVPEIADAVAEAAVLIGTVISWLVNLYGPQAVIIAGGFLDGNEAFLRRIEEEAEAGSISLPASGITLLRSTAQFDAEIRGIIIQALEVSTA